MLPRAEIETFLKEYRVRLTDENEAVLNRTDALTLLTRIIAAGGPLPAYVDVYSVNEAGKLHFQEDLTMRDFHDEQQSFEQYKERLCRYLAAEPENTICLSDFAFRD